MTHDEIKKCLDRLGLREGVDYKRDVNGLHIDYLLTQYAVSRLLSSDPAA